MRLKKAAAKKMADFLIEEGVNYSWAEYRNLSNTPLRIKEVSHFFRNWERMKKFIELDHPDLWEEIKELPTEKPKAAPPKVEVKEPKKVEPSKPAPKPAAKPTPKVAEKDK